MSFFRRRHQAFISLANQETSSPKPSYIKANATFENISIHLDISSGGLNQPDTDLDSTFSVQWRVLGTSTWKESAPPARCHPGYTIDTVLTTYNFWAASCMHLTPDTTYQIKVNYNDPDEGAPVVDIFDVSTEAHIVEPTTLKYCIAGTSGGDGSSGNPWQGLQTAADNLSPGETCMVANGTYAPVEFTKTTGTLANPFVFKATNARLAIIDGSGARNCIQVTPSSGTCGYVVFDGFEIRDAILGIEISDTNFFTLKNCYIHDVRDGIRAYSWDNGNINNSYIYNNKFIGNTVWPRTDGGWDSAKGIWAGGNNDTYAYNEVSNFDDGISWESLNFDEVNYGADIHHNYVHKIVDDAIEIDESVSNIRVYKNNIFDARDGLSQGPLHGGPCYVFRNVIYNMETSGHKLTRGGTGIYMYNNTEVMLGYGHVNSSSSKSTWNNTITKNMAGAAQWDNYFQQGTLPDPTDHDWDYNSFYTATTFRYVWSGTPYTTIAAMYAATGLAQNDQEITLSDFVDVSLPTDDYDAHVPGDYDFRPSVGSDLIGAGTKINNVNDPWDSASSPTSGAYVYNETLEQIGCNF